MRIIFLDFDGVLNSQQQEIYKRNRQISSTYWRLRAKLASFLYFSYRRVKLPSGSTTLQTRKDPFGILQWFTDFSHRYVGDHAEFCPIACSNVQYLLNQYPDLRIVISSVWRSDGVSRLGEILKRNGIDPSRLIDVTGRKGPGGTVARGRGDQIQAWLQEDRFDSHIYKTITHYAILDDDSDMCDLMDHLVLVDSKEGFMWRYVEECEKLLG